MSNDKRIKPLLTEARDLATNYNKLATEFSERIKGFQSQLKSIEFRVATNAEFNLDSQTFRLSFTNRVGGWGLYVDNKMAEGQWSFVGSLENLSVEMKVAATNVFPNLLENLIIAQYKAIQEIEAAHTVLDEMAEKIGSFEEEAE